MRDSQTVSLKKGRREYVLCICAMRGIHLFSCLNFDDFLNHIKYFKSLFYLNT